MDDKDFIVEYVVKEAARINERLKDLMESPVPPSDEMRNSIIGDIETTLSRLERAMAHIKTEIADNMEENNEEEKHNEQ